MSITENFEAAVIRSKKLPNQPNDVLLNIYSLFKQSTEGDINIEKPAMFDFVGAAKYNAWEALKGTSKDEAMQQYIRLIDSLESAS